MIKASKTIKAINVTVMGVSLIFGLTAGYSQAAPTAAESAQKSTPGAAPNSTRAAALLHPADLTRLLPPSVYFKGQSAPTQGRNSGGVHFPDDTYMFVALVDASGYSTSVQEKYQAYLVSDVPLSFEGHVLPSGAYGCGFRSGDRFVIMDLGGQDILTAHAEHDAAMRRPTPLQVLAGQSPDSFRIYEGRTSVTFSRIAEATK